MKLNAPEPKCNKCKGTGVYPRSLRVVVNGQVLPNMTIVALHCRCLSPELATLHDGLDKEPIFRDWPWDELSGLLIAAADKDAKPIKLGCPFPRGFVPPPRKMQPIVAPAAPEPAPKKAEPAPEKPKKKRGRAKIKD